MHIPIRHSEPGDVAQQYGLLLHVDQQQDHSTIPSVQLSLAHAFVQESRLSIRFHTQAGIPVAEAQCTVPQNVIQHSITNLDIFGLQAYRHASTEEQLGVAWRICSRIAYANIICLDKVL